MTPSVSTVKNQPVVNCNKGQDKPSLTKLGKSSGALFSLCTLLFCSSKRFSSYGFLLLVFPEEGKVGNKLGDAKRKRNVRLMFL